jgi:DNA-binding Lrp family transcriptional regulator
MVTAFVLINVQDRKVHEIADSLLAYEGVTELHIVAGEYDMVAVLRVRDNQYLSELITQKIIHTSGVERTKTLFALESFSPFDLAKNFNLD